MSALPRRADLACRAGLFLLLAGCVVTAVPAGTRAVRVETPGAPAASCRGAGKDGREYYWRKTPAVIAVRKEAFPLVLACEKLGYRRAIFVVDGAPAPPVPRSSEVVLKKEARALFELIGVHPADEEALLIRVPLGRKEEDREAREGPADRDLKGREREKAR